MRAGIDLGGTKMQAIVVDDGHAVLGQARLPTPTSGGPDAVVASLAESVRQACADAGVEPRALTGHRPRLAGRDRRGGRHRRQREEPARLDGGARAGGGAARRSALGLDVAGPDRQRRRRRHQRRVRARRRQAARLAARRLLGDRRRRRADPRRPPVERPRQRRGDRPHGRRPGRPQVPVRPHGCMEAYAGRGAMEARARHLHFDKGHKTAPLRDHGGAREGPAVLRRLGRARSSATTSSRRSYRGGRAGDRHRRGLRRQPARPGRGRHRRRDGRPLRRADGRAHPRGDAPAPVPRRRPARDPARRPGRPRRRARRRPAGHTPTLSFRSMRSPADPDDLASWLS